MVGKNDIIGDLEKLNDIIGDLEKLNDIIGDLEKLNDIITDIIFIIGRKMISFFPSN
jgi:hypothetical protein